MTLQDLLNQVKGLPPTTLICVAEEDEAFAMNVANVEVIENARAENRNADGTESVELDNGGETAVVIRW